MCSLNSHGGHFLTNLEVKKKGEKKSFQNINPTLTKKHKQEMLKPRAWLPWQLGFAKLPSQRSGPLLGMVASQICFDHQICGSSQMYWKGKVDLARSHLLGASSTWQLLVPLCDTHLLPTDVLWGRQRRPESPGDGHREEHKGQAKNYWTVTRKRCSGCVREFPALSSQQTLLLFLPLGTVSHTICIHFLVEIKL